ncbi:DUF1772 domain-containing protein [Chitinophaga barathri]|uniref:DUF1772 domain-containing protein n=1 Tax=Chitinophaga barathri TaxID=1647451 RepID=A0A3N4MN25_9BACT|nr:DUF1772 domain-containing protein [Chitinophaga barathri]RPD41450.1 DUF1772 domain-containing protein [Chitinophaga barathri]
MVPAFYDVPPAVHLVYRVQLMKYNSASMQAIMVLGFVTPCWFAWLARRQHNARNLALAAGLLAVTALLVTRFGNVPVNVLIRSWNPAAPPADWLELLHRWNVFNVIRTLAGAASFVTMIVCVLKYRGITAVKPLV